MWLAGNDRDKSVGSYENSNSLITINHILKLWIIIYSKQKKSMNYQKKKRYHQVKKLMKKNVDKRT